jgi:hypothetical protein
MLAIQVRRGLQVSKGHLDSRVPEDCLVRLENKVCVAWQGPRVPGVQLAKLVHVVKRGHGVSKATRGQEGNMDQQDLWAQQGIEECVECLVPLVPLDLLELSESMGSLVRKAQEVVMVQSAPWGDLAREETMAR